MKKSNFVFNYLAASFEKGLKFQFVRWRRIIKKIAVQDFYLHVDDDDNVKDIVEEKKKIEQLKSNSLVIKKFRNIALKNLRSKYSLIKDNFTKWRHSSTKLKILDLKEKKMLKSLLLREQKSHEKVIIEEQVGSEKVFNFNCRLLI